MVVPDALCLHPPSCTPRPSRLSSPRLSLSRRPARAALIASWLLSAYHAGEDPLPDRVAIPPRELELPTALLVGRLESVPFTASRFVLPRVFGAPDKTLHSSCDPKPGWWRRTADWFLFITHSVCTIHSRKICAIERRGHRQESFLS